MPGETKRMSETCTRAELIGSLNNLGFTQSEAAEVLEAVLSEISTVLEDGDGVKISGFGNFSVRQKCKRVGRNPKTGVEAVIAARKVVTFRAGRTLRAYLDGSAQTE